MKWSYFIRQKVKAAALLTGILAVVALASLSMIQAIQYMEQSIESVYADRLKPAVDLVHLSELFHRKRLLMQSFLTGQSPLMIQELKMELVKDNAQSDSLISRFEKTRLISAEEEKLNVFKADMTAYIKLENSVLRLEQTSRRKEAIVLFENQGGKIFQDGVSTLHAIADIQSDIGRKAVKSAHRQAAGGFIIFMLLIAVCVIVGLVILALLKNEKLIDRKSELFHLN
ncbi:MCP four helix bundle domain-containing protein [Dyadobacter sediminis]|nr:MCP four helix bundle domain-containing protein [Dyadobacter sediminis]